MHYHLRFKQRGVGDTVAGTGLVRDLLARGPDVRVSVDGTRAEEVFRFHPGVGPPLEGAAWTEIDYRATIDRGAVPDPTARYFYAAHDGFDAATGGTVPRGPPRPELVLGPAELARPYPERYAVVAAGSRSDMPVKQAPLDAFRAAIAGVPELAWKQVGRLFDGRFPEHHVALAGAENLIGRTEFRDLVRLIAHADLVLCHVSLPLTVAAAFGRPCVVLAGGRETPTTFDDCGAVLLHTIGKLPCCERTGCYASAAVPFRRPEEFPPGWLCRRPVQMPEGRPLGECMTLIDPAAVVAACRAGLKR